MQTRIQSHWAELYFPGRRYGHLTSNIAESLNAKLLPAREMPVLALLESIHKTLMDWFTEKCQLEVSTAGFVIKKVATQIQDTVNSQAHHYQFRQRINMQYEVNSNETLRDYLVNITEWSCSCWKWQATGIPCGHALGVIISGLKDNPQAYMEPFYSLNTFN